MKKSAYVILIAALAVVLICTGIGLAYLLVSRNDEGLVLDGVGSDFSEQVVIDGIAPGEARTWIYRGEADSSATFTVTLMSDGGALAQYLRVRILVGNAILCDDTLAAVSGQSFRTDVHDGFGFIISYSLGEEVGNEAQGAACAILAQYTLEGSAA